MRAMRPKEDKIALIIDHVSNFCEHGLPDDDRVWTLETKKKKKKGNEAPVKQCPTCFCCMHAKVNTCPECGHVFETKKAGNEFIDAELQEITREQLLQIKNTNIIKN
jgi:hypothetical protein